MKTNVWITITMRRNWLGTLGMALANEDGAMPPGDTEEGVKVETLAVLLSPEMDDARDDARDDATDDPESLETSTPK